MEIEGHTVPWVPSWTIGVALVVVTVVFHIVGLDLMNRGLNATLGHRAIIARPQLRFIAIMGAVALIATILHAIEAIAWAFAYMQVGAVGDVRDAVLYSIEALTAYGHTNIMLGDRWLLLGGLEALNGIMLFGLTTAFMFSVMQRVWQSNRH